MYRYPNATLADFLNTLNQVRDRLWLPHQVGLEYHRNREGRIPEQRQVLDRLLRDIESLDGTLERLALPEHHPVLDMTVTRQLQEQVKQALTTLTRQVVDARDATPERAERDEILERVTDLYEGRVGPPFSTDQIRQLTTEGAQRYAQSIPPGFKDRDKEEPRRYYDLIVWKQILSESAAHNDRPARPTLFVTSDRKDDWWRRQGDSLVGPRTELIREHLNVVGTDFLMYTPDQFLQDARTYLEIRVASETIVDVRRAAYSSAAIDSLVAQRMVLPERMVRVAALSKVYESLRAGTLRRAQDLIDFTERLGPEFTDRNVSVPFFFSLIHESYGPVLVTPDPTRRLRDRDIAGIRGTDSSEGFTSAGEAAWLAQALYRLRYEKLGEEELLVAFFGENYPIEAPTVLRRASDLVQSDYAEHGFQP